MLSSLFSLFYVTGEFHRFLHRGRAKFCSSLLYPVQYHIEAEYPTITNEQELNILFCTCRLLQSVRLIANLSGNYWPLEVCILQSLQTFCFSISNTVAKFTSKYSS